MGNRRLNSWKSWLQNISIVLLIVAAFAPLPETLHGILLLAASGGLLVHLITKSPSSRREVTRFLLPLVALVFLAWLVSIDPRWVIFGFVGIYCLWGVFRREHAEYLANRERLQ
jgi:hypothetical protein